MEIFKRINKTVKAKQIGKIIGGITCCGIGLYLLCDYFEQSGWTKCQQFIHQYYPEEYLEIIRLYMEGQFDKQIITTLVIM